VSKVQLHTSIVLALLVSVTVAVESAKPLKPEGRPRTSFASIPMQIGDWAGEDSAFDQRTYEMLPSCSLLMRFYQREYDLSPVGLAVIYGTDLGDFHQPEVCLEGQGLRAISKGTVRIKDGKSLFPAVSLVTERDYRRQIFVFWFYAEGLSSTSLGQYKVNILLSRLLMRGVRPSALIRFSTVVADSESESEAEGRIVQLANAVFPYLKLELDAPTSEERK
jgi:EpsI family protein